MVVDAAVRSGRAAAASPTPSDDDDAASRDEEHGSHTGPSPFNSPRGPAEVHDYDSTWSRPFVPALDGKNATADLLGGVGNDRGTDTELEKHQRRPKTQAENTTGGAAIATPTDSAHRFDAGRMNGAAPTIRADEGREHDGASRMCGPSDRPTAFRQNMEEDERSGSSRARGQRGGRPPPCADSNAAAVPHNDNVDDDASAGDGMGAQSRGTTATASSFAATTSPLFAPEEPRGGARFAPMGLGLGGDTKMDRDENHDDAAARSSAPNASAMMPSPALSYTSSKTAATAASEGTADSTQPPPSPLGLPVLDSALSEEIGVGVVGGGGNGGWKQQAGGAGAGGAGGGASFAPRSPLPPSGVASGMGAASVGQPPPTPPTDIWGSESPLSSAVQLTPSSKAGGGEWGTNAWTASLTPRDQQQQQRRGRLTQQDQLQQRQSQQEGQQQQQLAPQTQPPQGSQGLPPSSAAAEYRRAFSWDEEAAVTASSSSAGTTTTGFASMGIGAGDAVTMTPKRLAAPPSSGKELSASASPFHRSKSVGAPSPGGAPWYLPPSHQQGQGGPQQQQGEAKTPPFGARPFPQSRDVPSSMPGSIESASPLSLSPAASPMPPYPSVPMGSMQAQLQQRGYPQYAQQGQQQQQQMMGRQGQAGLLGQQQQQTPPPSPYLQRHLMPQQQQQHLMQQIPALGGRLPQQQQQQAQSQQSPYHPHQMNAPQHHQLQLHQPSAPHGQQHQHQQHQQQHVAWSGHGGQHLQPPPSAHMQQQQHQHQQHQPPHAQHLQQGGHGRSPAPSPSLRPRRGAAGDRSPPSPSLPHGDRGGGGRHHDGHQGRGDGRGGRDGGGGHHRSDAGTRGEGRGGDGGRGDRGPGGGGPDSSSLPRSSPEILKTLLRKKACLYEPRTSRAISLVAWTVGKRLARTRGYFSRQQLQGGVHACVRGKIEGGQVTRTKVNRCLQVVLNSCFHYIIPRVDGSEESGVGFAEEFREQVDDEIGGEDEMLLRSLGRPWGDLVECCERGMREFLAHIDSPSTDEDDDDQQQQQASSGKAAGQASSGRGGQPSEGEGGKAQQSQSKRAVLLCFNENVRSAADVFLCHDEFVRDAARAAGLHLSAEEWRSFFAGGSGVGGLGLGAGQAGLSAEYYQQGGGVGSVHRSRVGVFGGDAAASSSYYSPHGSPASMKSLLAVPAIPSLSWDDGEKDTSKAAAEQAPAAPVAYDVLGRLPPSSLSKFRTTWCSKRYDHDPSSCRFAHVDVNGGWLRRDTTTHEYSAEMCPNVVKLTSRGGAEPGGLVGVTINSCPRGAGCPMAHSWEEVAYHPLRYKSNRCERALPPSPRGGSSGREGVNSVPRCPLGDVCPDLHPRGMFRGSGSGGRTKGQGQGQHSPPHTSTRPGGGRPRSGSDASAGGGGRAGGGARHARPAAHDGPRGVEALTPQPPPMGPPMLYIRPSPSSDFDKYLILPGTRELFRRQSAVWSAFRTGGAGGGMMEYSLFGDDWGLGRWQGRDDAPADKSGMSAFDGPVISDANDGSDERE